MFASRSLHNAHHRETHGEKERPRERQKERETARERSRGTEERRGIEKLTIGELASPRVEGPNDGSGTGGAGTVGPASLPGNREEMTITKML